MASLTLLMTLASSHERALIVDVTKVFANRCQRSLARSSEEADDAGEFDAAESGFANLRRDRANVRFVASSAVAGER